MPDKFKRNELGIFMVDKLIFCLRLLSLAALSFLICGYAIADDVKSTKVDSAPLTIREALIMAIQTHPSVVMKRNEYAGSIHALDSAKWQRFPAVSASTSASQASSNPVTILTIEQPLWTGGRITANIESTKAKAIASEAAIFEAEQNISIKMVSAFSEILRLQSRIVASKENVEEHERLLELIERRARNQISPETEVVIATARLQQAKSELIQLQTQLANSKADLEQIISTPFNQLRIPVIKLDTGDALEPLLQQALDYSPQLNRLRYEVIGADFDVDAKKAVLMPQLTLRHQEFWGGNYPNNMTYLAINLQPGNGLSAFSNIKEAQSKRESAESNMDLVRKDLADGIRTDWFKVQSVRAEIEIYKKLIEATKKDYESSVRLYAAGRKGWTDVLNFRKEATAAKYQLADAEWSGFLAMMKIKINSGAIAEYLSVLDAGSANGL